VSRRTIARPAECRGVGLHSGLAVTLRLEPARPGSGIVFERQDPAPRGPVPATLDAVGPSERRTTLGDGAARIDTVEHLLAAVYAAELDDLRILLDGPEVPILDGSFAPFCALLDSAGCRIEPGVRRAAWLEAAVELDAGEGSYRMEPAEGLVLEVRLDYPQPVIGRQRAGCRVESDTFRQQIAGARTYGFLAEVEPLQARGLLAGATAACAVVLSPTAVLNTELRWPDEFARHKLGDLVGDLALVGARLNARIVAERPSHRGNLACARALARAARIVEA
jgi:UDP-3-O-acyl N-acetylglucosamine deacetylase